MIRLLLTTLFVAAVLPASAQVSVRSALSDDREVLPGATYTGTILVRNETDQPQQARIYQTDYHFYSDGTNRYEEAGTMPRSNAGWIQFSPSLLTLPPGETLPVSYEVTVPDTVGQAVPVGTYWSMVMVEGIPPNSPTSTLGDATHIHLGVQQVTRYGVQIATHVIGQPADLPLKAVVLPDVNLVQQENGAKVLNIAVENTGVQMIRPAMWVEVYDEQGQSKGRIEGAVYRIYPGTSILQQFDLGQLPAGTYQALVVVDAGGNDLFGAQYTLDL